jgi:hypothetical protein
VQPTLTIVGEILIIIAAPIYALQFPGTLMEIMLLKLAQLTAQQDLTLIIIREQEHALKFVLAITTLKEL